MDKAMLLYVKANKPAKAARLALRNSYILQDGDTTGQLKNMLVKQGKQKLNLKAYLNYYFCFLIFV